MKNPIVREKLLEFFRSAQRSYPRSFLAFNPNTGEVLTHSEDFRTFQEDLEALKRSNPSLDPTLSIPKKEGVPKRFVLAQALMLTRTITSA